MGILRIFQRRRNRKLWQAYLSPEEVAKLLRETKPEIKPPEVKHFQFVVILADDTNPQEVPAIISTVMGTFVHHHANVSTRAEPPRPETMAAFLLHPVEIDIRAATIRTTNLRFMVLPKFICASGEITVRFPSSSDVTSQDDVLVRVEPFFGFVV